MSCAIHRFDASQLRLIEAQRAREGRADVFARPKSTRNVPLRPSSAQIRRLQVPSVTALSPAVSSSRRVNFEHQNREHLNDMQRQLRLQREEAKLSTISNHFAEVELRERALEALRRPRSEANRASSQEHPSNHFRDPMVSDDIQHTGITRDHTPPAYLARRIQEQRNAREQQLIAAAVLESERSFPSGRQPMDPDVAERTKQFLAQRQIELAEQLKNFSFVAAQSTSGQRRKTQLEMQLREVEEALARFQFPVVFIKTSKPQSVPDQRRMVRK